MRAEVLAEDGQQRQNDSESDQVDKDRQKNDQQRGFPRYHHESLLLKSVASTMPLARTRRYSGDSCPGFCYGIDSGLPLTGAHAHRVHRQETLPSQMTQSAGRADSLLAETRCW